MKYDEIIKHKYYEPKKHPRMSREERVAQFSSFSALSGYDKVIRRATKIAELRGINTHLNFKEGVDEVRGRCEGWDR